MSDSFGDGGGTPGDTPPTQPPTQPVVEPPSQPPTQPVSGWPTEPPTQPPTQPVGPPVTEPVAGAGAFGPPPGSFAAAPAGPSQPSAPLPEYVPAPPPRKRGRFVVIAVGVVIALAGAAFAVTQLASSTDGASSPEGAVHDMFNAIDREDIVGVLESLPPGERDVVKDPFVDTANELKRLGIFSDSLDLHKVPGFDIEVKDIGMTTDTLGDEVVAVHINQGTVKASTIPDSVPLGDTLKNIVDDAGGDIDIPRSTETTDLADNPLDLVTIKEGGGWHVSLFYSIAELIRKEVGADKPDFGHGVIPDGASTPDGAVREMADAIADLDVEKMIALLPPDEMRALQDYAPLFLPDAQRAIDDIKDQGYDVKVDRLDLTTNGSGDTRTVLVKGIKVSGDTPDGELSFDYDGKCVTVTVPEDSGITFSDDNSGSGSSDSGSSGSGSSDDTTQKICTSDAAKSTDLGELGDVLKKVQTDSVGFIVVNRDGKWYLSPSRTIGTAVTTILKALDKSDINKLFEALSSVAVTEAGSGSSSGPGDCCSDATTTTFSTDTTDTTLGSDTTATTSDSGSLGDQALQDPTPPDGLGDDPELNQLADACYQGEMQSCDDLFDSSDFGSDYETYGGSCAGRLPENIDLCVNSIGPEAPN
jgi:hypothetical protein